MPKPDIASLDRQLAALRAELSVRYTPDQIETANKFVDKHLAIIVGEFRSADKARSAAGMLMLSVMLAKITTILETK